jgi:hypothetical protein
MTLDCVSNQRRAGAFNWFQAVAAPSGGLRGSGNNSVRLPRPTPPAAAHIRSRALSVDASRAAVPLDDEHPRHRSRDETSDRLVGAKGGAGATEGPGTRINAAAAANGAPRMNARARRQASRASMFGGSSPTAAPPQGQGKSSAAERLHPQRRRKAARWRRHCKVPRCTRRCMHRKVCCGGWGTAKWTVGQGARLAETALEGDVDV